MNYPGFKHILLSTLLFAGIQLGAQLPPQNAHAFCGFYVAGADQEMFNNATMVVMMREGTKTVLSMRNNYEGPPEDFAMVIPVPEVLKKENVKTLKNDLFDKVDKLASPRLVEYWEYDPCSPALEGYDMIKGGLGMRGTGFGGGGMQRSRSTVKIEAEFDVGEYNVVVLSAKESTGLESWLKENNYNIPDNAAPVLKPYIEQGQYFFVARVNPKKVAFKDGQAQLSPLRFSYDSKDFFLPVRLGLLNAKGHQDLIVHILAKNTRYEVANYKNVTIPTNLIVKPDTRDKFANFYVSLFDRVLEENPGAVITEYAWSAASCDPCPGPTLDMKDLKTLGLDIIDDTATNSFGNPWTLTRLHARYTEKDLNEDLVFQKAEAIVGGRGTPQGLEVMKTGALDEQQAAPSSINNFQGRYIMLNPWEGDIKCEKPQRGVWGGNPKSKDLASENIKGTAQDTAFATRDARVLEKNLITKLEILSKDKPAPAQPKDEAAPTKEAEAKEPATDTTPTPEVPVKVAEKKASKGCATAETGASHIPTPLFTLLGLLGALLGLRRVRKD